MNTFDYIHSKGIVVQDISAKNLAIGSSTETMNKVYIFDFASSVQVSQENLPKTDLIAFGLVLLDLNGIEFPPLQSSSKGKTIKKIDDIIERLMEDWNENYVKVMNTIYNQYLLKQNDPSRYF